MEPLLQCRDMFGDLGFIGGFADNLDPKGLGWTPI